MCYENSCTGFVCCRDHAGGNDKIKELVPGIKVYGGSIDNVRGCTDKVENGDKISLGADINVLSLHTPWYATVNLIYGSTSVTCMYSSLPLSDRQYI